MTFAMHLLNSWLAFCICLVCGNRSTGIHYGVLSCEGCKAFYKRGLVKSTSYKCFFGKICSVNPLAANRCKACRFQKCVEAGMDVQGTRRGRGRKLQVSKKKLNENGSPDSLSVVESTSEAKFSENVSSKSPAFGEHQYYPSGHFSDEWVTQRKKVEATGETTANPETTAIDTSLSVVEKKNGQFSSDPFRSEESDSTPLPADLDRLGKRRTTVSQLSLSSCWTFQKPIEVPDHGWLNRRTLIDRDREMLNLNANDKEEGRSNLPGFFRNYWEIIQKESFLIKNTIRAVSDAAQVVYHDQLTEWSEFMQEALTHGNVPHQPQVTLQSMIEIVRDSVADCLRRGCRFLFLLPGFSDLEQTDQKILFVEKFSETWLMVHAPYVWNKESYYLVGPQDNKIHYSQYWMRQLLEETHREIIFSWTDKIKELKLNQVEYFLLLAVATFRPETTTAKNKNLLSFLHAHYLDCLLYSIRSRSSEPEERVIKRKLGSFMTLFRSVYRLGNVYVRSLDYTRTPFQAVKGSVIITTQEALLAENDGLLTSDP